MEIAPETTGLCHISEIELDKPVGVISEWTAGDSIDVKVISVSVSLQPHHGRLAAFRVAEQLELDSMQSCCARSGWDTAQCGSQCFSSGGKPALYLPRCNAEVLENMLQT